MAVDVIADECTISRRLLSSGYIRGNEVFIYRFQSGRQSSENPRNGGNRWHGKWRLSGEGRGRAVTRGPGFRGHERKKRKN